MTDDKARSAAPARLPRRLVALAYDAIIVFALMFVTTAAYLRASGLEVAEPGDWRLSACLVGVSFAYFVLCWVHYGRTPGMRAWRLWLEDPAGRRPGYGACSVRFIGGCVSLLACGGGFVWAAFDLRGLTWHDRWSITRLVHRRAGK